MTEQQEGYQCEHCGSEITGTRVTFHEDDGIHIIHLTCHDEFLRERGIEVANINVYPAGEDA